MSTSDLYDQLVAIGAEIDNHESDLYVKATPEAVALVKASTSKSWAYFRSEVDGTSWIDVPFYYSPFWRARERAS